MTKLARSAFALTLVLGLGGIAVAQGMKKSDPHAAGHAVHASDSTSTKAFKEAHIKMTRDMTVSYSGNTDLDFVRGMIPHHQGAIDMAKVQLAHGKDPAIRTLAEKIIVDQEKEIAQMKDWLKKNAK
jgi:uncharacterized protein (DUF305 family)